MKFTTSDFPLIRTSLITICVSAIISAMLLFSSGEYAAKTQKDRREAQSQLNNARNLLNAARDDQANMATYADEYVVVLDRKIIGDEQRLDWMEGLAKIRGQNLVADFRYEIAPQKIFTPSPPIDGGNFDIHYSEMKLHFDLLHEEELLNFFTVLRQQIKGRYQLDGCTLQQADTDENDIQASLKAECTGGWITLKNRNEPK